MSDLTEWESHLDVRAIAHAAGFDPSEVQLKKWRSRGLIPRPVGATGAGRGHGVALYPPGTGSLLAAICRYAQPKRSMERTGFLAWWDGAPVDPSIVRGVVTADLDGYNAVLTRWRSMADDDRASAAYTIANDTRLPPTLRVVRSRVGRKAFGRLVVLLIRMASGESVIWEMDEDRHAFMHGLGLDSAKHDWLGTVSPWLRGFVTTQLSHLALIVKPRLLQEVINQASDDDLAQARDELQTLFGVLYDVRRVLESMLGAKFPDRSYGLLLAPGPDGPDPAIRPMLLTAWLALRLDHQVAEGYEAITGEAERLIGQPLSAFASLTRRTDK